MNLVGRMQRNVDRHYLPWLIGLALAGWALASYDFNLLVLTIPNISKTLHLSAGRVGSLVFFVYAAEFVMALLAGRVMDAWGRKGVWQYTLVGAAIFTGLTFFVNSFLWLVVVRCLASAFAQTELAISVTMVTEETPGERRGLLYSVVQGGWPLGVFLASAIYSLTIGYGWHVVFLFGVLPILVVIGGRFFLREPERWEHLQEVREAKSDHDSRKARRLMRRYSIDPETATATPVRRLFGEAGPVRRQLVLLSVVWLFYAASFTATNVYITDWLTRSGVWTATGAAHLLLVAAGVGFGFYVVGGWLGERSGRREVLIGTACLVAPLNLAFYFFHPADAWGWLLYVAVYQVTNGTWSGAGYAYWGESFPTEVRGTAIGWLGGMFALGLLIGAGIWTIVIDAAGRNVAWLVVAVGLAVGQLLSVFLRHIDPGQELEAVDTGSAPESATA